MSAYSRQKLMKQPVKCMRLNFTTIRAETSEAYRQIEFDILLPVSAHYLLVNDECSLTKRKMLRFHSSPDNFNIVELYVKLRQQ